MTPPQYIITNLHKKIISVALIATKLVISVTVSLRSAILIQTSASRTIITNLVYF